MVRDALRTALAPLMAEVASLRHQVAELRRKEVAEIVVVRDGALPASLSDGAICFRLSDQRCFVRSDGTWNDLTVV